MKRIIEESLNNWANKLQHKPLIIRGARQIGKSWSVRNLGNMCFKGNFIEINLEKSPSLHKVFKHVSEKINFVPLAYLSAMI